MSKLPKANPPKVEKRAINTVFDKLGKLYPDTSTELTYDSPFQLLIAVILSAQCTDERVNKTTPALFKAYPTATKLAVAKNAAVEKIIKPCGFYRNKAKSIINCSKSLLENHGGEVPSDLDALTALAGVGRKTASVILNQAFDLPAIAVDTHVKRVSHRLGWTDQTDPVKVEMDLRELLPENRWAQVNGMLILHGRRVCKARKPLCSLCSVQKQCRHFSTLPVES